MLMGWMLSYSMRYLVVCTMISTYLLCLHRFNLATKTIIRRIYHNFKMGQTTNLMHFGLANCNRARNCCSTVTHRPLARPFLMEDL